MAQFLIKYSSTSGVVPTSAELPIRQIAVNTADGKLFIKKNDGTILTFESADVFARAVHSHAISDVTGLQDALDTLTTAASAAQSGADASLKSASNLSDLGSASTARTNLGVDSSVEVDGKISTSKTASDSYTDAAIAALINGSPATLDTLKEIADALAAGSDVATALATSIAGVSSRVDTLEGQNLDSRLTTAQSAADAAQGTADSAVSAASTAQSTADTAVTNAATAQSAADAAQSTADSAVSAAATAQSGADASVKKSANLGDLADAAASRTNLGVDSSGEVDSKVSTAVGAAQTTLQTSIDGVSGRVTTLEGQNLDSRLSSAEGTIAGLGTMSTQNADNITITGGSIGAGSVPTDSGVILTENSTIDGGTFSGFNGGGGGGDSTPYAVSLPGANNYLMAPGLNLGIGTGNYTIEMFTNISAYNPAGADLAVLFDARGVGTLSSEGPLFYVSPEAGHLRLYSNNGVVAEGTEALPIPTSGWHHLAAVRENGAVTLYIDGVSVASGADSTNWTSSQLFINAIEADTSLGADMKVGSLRVSSVARYSGSAFTPPSAVFTSDGSTALLALQGASLDGGIIPFGSASMVVRSL
ncbi:Concanavalin A-like lectin/glucanases superfamily [uncultured Caudovirales phage]|uniref:Concanavalin A-like lectin/glucanases superfamily n=6 Tax=uncultured Caudovirales phage TaxID=2100421 RepID=A0A6J7XDH3_9CAUD|nr:Concanavalin A-like lectin/glucanases superfamily [uncultured Caudovirales phage]CAB4171367.1 Concanavalin A-like lectin/glucanases superfamily [uncultured Caudovirales phage]CAB5228043.1 Concanavalin A-like lectin/glucanases superfamily [uncultured Caudovirales phage]